MPQIYDNRSNKMKLWGLEIPVQRWYNQFFMECRNSHGLIDVDIVHVYYVMYPLNLQKLHDKL